MRATRIWMFVLVILQGAAAAAQESPGWRADDHGLVISAERLFGVHVNVATAEYANEGAEATSTSFMANFLWGSSVSTEGVNLYAMPHLALYGVVGPGLTVGGSVGFFSRTGAFEQNVGNFEGESIDLPSTFGFMLTPRFGGILPVNSTLSFWPRGGVTFYNVGTTIPESGVTQEFTTNEFGVALSIDPMLVFTPVPHVGLLIGPTIDIGLGGSFDTDSEGQIDTDDGQTLRQSNFGLVFGLAVFL